MKNCITVLFAIALFSTGVNCQPLKVFFGNLHSHTSYSDGVSTPEVAYAHARDVAGIDFLAITEHNHSQAGRIAVDTQLYSGTVSTSVISTANRYNEDGRFVALYGQEFSTISAGNHANVFEVNQVISTVEVPNGEWNKLLDTWLNTHLDSQGQPAIMLLNHPSISGCDNNVEYGIDDYADVNAWRTALNGHATMMNMVNGPSHDNVDPGAASEREYLRYLNLGLYIAPTADQDNHRMNWGNAADTRTGVVCSTLTKASILNALRVRNVYASEDKNLKVIGKINGELMGKKFGGAAVPSAGTNLQIELQIDDADEPDAIYTIYVYEDKAGGVAEADVIKQYTRTGNGTYTLDSIKYTGGDEYFFIKIKQTDDDAVEVDRAWLAPVWFEPNATPTTTTPAPVTALTLTVNLETEEATVTNIGSDAINLKDWKVVSTIGTNQFYKFSSFSLPPGKSVIVTSGPNAKVQLPDFLKWSTGYKWTNTGDPGELLDVGGVVRARSE
jgi:hypothetical protein